jgi:hypothetical protein
MRDRAEASIERAEAMDGRSERPGDGDRQSRACVTHDVVHGRYRGRGATYATPPKTVAFATRPTPSM